MVEAETEVALPASGGVIPEGVELLFGRMEGAQRIGPALVKDAPPQLSRLRLHHRVVLGRADREDVAILAKGDAPALRRVGLPGDPDDTHSRYIEAEAHGIVVASLYLPNGNPVGTEKFDYKLKWMDRLRAHAAELLAEERAVVLAGDWNVVPEDRDVFSARAAANDALLQPETRAAWRQILHQGWTEALRAFHPNEPKLYTFWDYTAGCWQRDAGFRIDHLLCSPEATDRLQAAGVDRWARGEEKASDHAPTWVELS